MIVIFYYIFEIVLQAKCNTRANNKYSPHYNTCISFLGNMDMCWVGCKHMCMDCDMGRYYLNEKEFRLNIISIFIEKYVGDIDIIERRTMFTDLRDERKLVNAIYFYLQKGCTEKEKRKTRNNFYTMHRNELCL